MAKHCATKHCKEPIEAGWLFCPYCGTDNRPETFRPPIIACPHLFWEQEGFCVRCGDCRDGRPSAAQRRVQNNIGKAMFNIGLLAIIAAVAAYQIHANHYPGFGYVTPWYDETYASDGKVLLKGDDYVSWAEIGGGVLCVAGIFARVVARLNAGKARKRQHDLSTAATPRS